MLELNNMAFIEVLGHNMAAPAAHVDTLHTVSCRKLARAQVAKKQLSRDLVSLGRCID
jgi:hypothetical protein